MAEPGILKANLLFSVFFHFPPIIFHSILIKTLSNLFNHKETIPWGKPIIIILEELVSYDMNSF